MDTNAIAAPYSIRTTDMLRSATNGHREDLGDLPAGAIKAPAARKPRTRKAADADAE